MQLNTQTCVPATELSDFSYCIGHETVIASPDVKGMAPWREELFVAMQRSTVIDGTSFAIPSRQVVEIGMEFVI